MRKKTGYRLGACKGSAVRRYLALRGELDTCSSSTHNRGSGSSDTFTDSSPRREPSGLGNTWDHEERGGSAAGCRAIELFDVVLEIHPSPRSVPRRTGKAFAVGLKSIAYWDEGTIAHLEQRMLRSIRAVFSYTINV